MNKGLIIFIIITITITISISIAFISSRYEAFLSYTRCAEKPVSGLVKEIFDKHAITKTRMSGTYIFHVVIMVLSANWRRS